MMSWRIERLFWSGDGQLAVPSQNPTQRGRRVRVVHRTPCSNCTQMTHPASGCKCPVTSTAHLSNLFVNAVTRSLFSFFRFHSLPPSSSCTSRPRLSRASRNKLLQHRVAALSGWIPRLIRCKIAYSPYVYRLHHRNIGSLHKTCVHPNHHVYPKPSTCHRSSRELELEPDYASRRVQWGHLRCDHDCHTGYTTHVSNIYFGGPLLNHTFNDGIHGGTLAPLIKKSLVV